ncbi:hypothetical protein GRJ2_000910000 [Grus japonensis]|uniref:Uncharacterized protein n=1 Tax=Grus japonensis TaxID=30415 RepID=A0ABC9WJF0_GRUJA
MKTVRGQRYRETTCQNAFSEPVKKSVLEAEKNCGSKTGGCIRAELAVPGQTKGLLGPIPSTALQLMKSLIMTRASIWGYFSRTPYHTIFYFFFQPVKSLPSQPLSTQELLHTCDCCPSLNLAQLSCTIFERKEELLKIKIFLGRIPLGS